MHLSSIDIPNKHLHDSIISYQKNGDDNDTLRFFPLSQGVIGSIPTSSLKPIPEIYNHDKRIVNYKNEMKVDHKIKEVINRNLYFDFSFSKLHSNIPMSTNFFSVIYGNKKIKYNRLLKNEYLLYSKLPLIKPQNSLLSFENLLEGLFLI